MCGIAGWIDWERDLTRQQAVISAMTRTLTPRGPDAEGTWVSDHALLGHRRLAVIDIEGGAQPMVRWRRADEPVAVTFSGEIYNFRELRTQLRGRGWSFTTRSDTEVLLVAYLEWGTELVDHLNGMYAFAIWDERPRRLLLVRDRLGIKPLYYLPTETGILFGSEPKALLAHPQTTAEVDAEGIAELLAVPRARTPGHGVYRGLRELRPGYVLVVDPAGRRERRYWALSAQPHRDDVTTTVAHIRERLIDILRHQVVADVPIGSLLSGGIDSSAITAMAAEQLAGDLTSFSVTVPNSASPGSDTWRPSSDEPYARLVAERLGIKRFVTEVDADALVEGLDRGLIARDIPGWGDLDTSMYLLFRTARQHCTVALSGEAADEMFGGYAWQLDGGYTGHDSFPWMYGRRQPEQLLRDEVRRVVEPKRYEARRYHEALAEVPHLPGESAERRREREVFYLGLTRWLGALLDRKDRMSMAVGLEVRVPFADHVLADYLFNVPMAMKSHGGIEKALLRGACAGLLPEEIITRPKSAYPASRDIGYLERMRTMVLDLLAEPGRPVFDVIDREKVRAAVATGLDGMPGPITAITPAISLSYLLQLDRWLELYGVRIVL